ncbi:MAG: ABC transporter permease [Cyclobacteriaceae bacterium]
MNRKKHRPPQWADRFLEWYCAPQFIEETQGDLHEAFHRRCKEVGPHWARWLFIIDVMRSLSVRTFDYSFLLSRNSLAMLRNYTKLTFRNLLRKKAFSFINIVGLAIGMTAFFLIIQYISFERSYDRFHANNDRIYRVCLDTQTPTRHVINAANHPGTAPALKAEYPEVEDYARMLPQSFRMGKLVALSYVDEKNEEKMFYEDQIYVVDPSFLTILSFPMKYGDPGTALTDPSSIVLTESVARKYFGTGNPVGKTLTLNGRRTFTVTGVLKDIPGNSHIKFDILVSFWIIENLKGNFDEEGHWKWPEFYTYVRLAPNVDVKNFESKLESFYERHNAENLRMRNAQERVRLQPLTDIHLRSPEMINEREVHGSEQMVFFLLIIAGLIILIAWINYINLSTSKSMDRAREIGLRKVVGAVKRQLITQFLFESATINFLALLVACLLTILAYPYFSDLTGKNMGSSFFEATLIQEPLFWWVVAGIFFSGSFLAGFYPAFMLSSFRIVTALKGKFLGSQSGIVLRKVLVTSQFIISVALIAGTIMIFRQVQFMRTHELGFVKDQLLVVTPPRVADSTFRTRRETFKAEVRRNPHIRNITSTSEIPGALVSDRNGIRRFDEGIEAATLVYIYFVDYAFIPTYGLTMAGGRNFTEDERLISPDARSNPIIVNRKVIETLGYKNADEAVNQLVYFGLGAGDWVGEIVGVVENFSQVSLKTDYEPLIFFPASFSVYFTINLDMENLPETISFLRQQYELAFPGNLFDYFFMDDYFNRQYIADQQFGQVLGLFTGLALIIAGLGLYGLTIFMVSQRTKELALRRILGASLSNIVRLFSKDFVRLIIIANVIALPVVYLLADRWLDNFAFRIDIGWIMFVVPFLILLTISLTTVSFQTIKTGLTNHVKSLRSE